MYSNEKEKRGKNMSNNLLLLKSYRDMGKREKKSDNKVFTWSLCLQINDNTTVFGIVVVVVVFRAVSSMHGSTLLLTNILTLSIYLTHIHTHTVRHSNSN